MTLAAIQQLKKRIRELKRMEAQSRRKLSRVVQQAEKIAKIYQVRLNSAIRQAKLKEAFNTAVAYARTACKMEGDVLKRAKKTGEAMMSAFVKIEDEIVKSVKKSPKKKVKKSRAKRTGKSRSS